MVLKILYYYLNKVCFPKPDVKFSIKVVINKHKTKVLFAEIDSHFADVLLSFLALPLGKIVSLLEQHYGCKAPVFGSLTTLYHSLSNLDGNHFRTEGCKHMLLNPVSSLSEECSTLKLDIADNQPTKYFSCPIWCCRYPRKHNIALYRDAVSCDCGRPLKREIHVGDVASRGVGEVFTKSTATFLLSDDLKILPNLTASVTKIVGELGLEDLDGTEWRNVIFGFNEIMDLLKASLIGETPLTDVILEKQTKNNPVTTVHVQIAIRTLYTDKLSTVTVILQKSTNKLLYVEAEEEFVDFLFSLLSIPLGKVEKLLDGNSCLKNIDNLYRSVACPTNGIDTKYLRDPERTKLIDPTVYVSDKHLFRCVEKIAHRLSYFCDADKKEEYLYLSPPDYRNSASNVILKFPYGNFVNKGAKKFMVKDDLTVIPLFMTSYLSTINEQGIPLSDVDRAGAKNWITRGFKHIEGVSYIDIGTIELSQSLVDEATKARTMRLSLIIQLSCCFFLGQIIRLINVIFHMLFTCDV